MIKEIKEIVAGSDYDIETSDVDNDNVHLEVWDKYVTKQINNVTQSFELSIGKEPIMSEDDFNNKYCAACGTQRCSGINDHIFREGCQFYQKEYKYPVCNGKGVIIDEQ